MPLPARRRRLRQRRGRGRGRLWLSRLLREEVLRFLEDYPSPEVLYVELWMVPMLFGPRAQRLAEDERSFGVLILRNAASRCRVVLFVVGESWRRCAVAFLIRSPATRLRIRRNRARTRVRRLESSARASGRSG